MLIRFILNEHDICVCSIVFYDVFCSIIIIVVVVLVAETLSIDLMLCGKI